MIAQLLARLLCNRKWG